MQTAAAGSERHESSKRRLPLWLTLKSRPGSPGRVWVGELRVTAAELFPVVTHFSAHCEPPLSFRAGLLPGPLPLQHPAPAKPLERAHRAGARPERDFSFLAPGTCPRSQPQYRLLTGTCSKPSWITPAAAPSHFPHRGPSRVFGFPFLLPAVTAEPQSLPTEETSPQHPFLCLQHRGASEALLQSRSSPLFL